MNRRQLAGYLSVRGVHAIEHQLEKHDATIAAQAARIEALRQALESALKTAEFERHPFRPWHREARALLGAVPVVGAGTRAEVEG